MSQKPEFQKIYSLSPMQEGMLFHSLLDTGSSAYFHQMTLSISGSFDVALLEKSFQLLIERYDVFRTNFVHQKLQKPKQVVFKEKAVKVYYKDISGLDEAGREAFVRKFKEEDMERGFDLMRDVLVRLAVLHLGNGNYKVIWSHHHIIMDGWCLGIVLKELFQVYRWMKNRQPVAVAPVYPYSSYIQWLEGVDREEAERYWKKTLENYEPHGMLPMKAGGVREKGYVREERCFVMEDTMVKALELVARKNQVTLNTVFQTLWGILLQRFNNTEDVVFGSVVSGRPAEIPGVESIVGLFINTVPIRVQYAERQPFSALLKQVQESALSSEKYGYVSLADIQAVSGIRKGLIESLVVFDNYPLERELVRPGTEQEAGFVINRMEMFDQTSIDLNLIIVPGDSLEVKFNYNSLVYDGNFLDRVWGYLKRMAEQVVQNPELPADEMELLPEAEKKQILDDFNGMGAEYPINKTIHEMFEEQVGKTPGATAAVFGNKSLSYGELNRMANGIAYALKEKGVGRGSLVGVLSERSLELIAAVLGVLKAGGVLVPIDPGYPAERISYMLQDSGAGVLLTQRHLAEKFEFRGITLDLRDEALHRGETSNPENVNEPSDLLYLIYTSGTTGKPKGVMLEHGNMVNLVNFQYNKTNIDFKIRVMQFATISFDVCYQEIFSTLLAGGTLVVADEETRKDAARLFDYIEENEVNILFLPTSFVKFVLSEEEYLARLPGCVRHIITAGEQLIVTGQLKKRLKAGNICLHNHYGPSETHVVTAWTAGPGEDVPELPPIGRPVSGNRMHILYKGKVFQPVGAPGELYISGAGVGRGYWNRPELTAEKFMPDPFVSPGTRYPIPITQRMYRTGDLARWMPDGNIEFLGRMDHQVKVRGFRVEPGEIETQLLNHPSVKEAAVIAREDAKGVKYLCAYFSAAEKLAAPELRKYLSGMLPEYMIPAYFVQVDGIPRSPSGKVNGKALPQPEGSVDTGVQYAAPENEVQEKLAGVWREVLRIEKPGIDDSFFELGGHSLKATILVARIHKELNIQIPLGQVFKTPTIRGLSAYIENMDGNTYESIQPVKERDLYPVSSVQKRLYIVSQMTGPDCSYNVPAAMMVEGNFDRERYIGTVKEMVRRHEAFRTSFETAGGEPVQRIHREVDFDVSCMECEETEVKNIIEEFIRPFDLGRAPLLRTGIVKLPGERHVLLFDMHHIICDGVSIDVFIKEVVTLYKGGSLPLLRIQHKDYAVWQQELLKAGGMKKQEEYWLGVFRGPLPTLDMPLDYPRPPVRSSEGDLVSFTADRELSVGLNRLAAETGTTLYMVLLAVFNVLLAKYSGQDDIVVGSPVAGRPHADLENIIGMFVNTLPMRNFPGGNKTFRSFLQEVRENTLKAFENQDYQLEELVEKLDVKRDLSRNPLFDVSFILQNMDMEEARLDNATFTPMEFENRVSKFDLTLTAQETGEGISFGLRYCTRLYMRKTAERMAERFISIAKEAVSNPDVRLCETERMTDVKKQMLSDFSDDLENE